MIEHKPVATAGYTALWNLGFRPFYLLAGVFAAISIPVWIGQYIGFLPPPHYQGATWHAHEMLFGYALAVVAGFLLTAVRVWTGQPTPSGLMLAAIVLLWLAGRILMLTPYDVAATLATVAFPLAVATGIGMPLLRSGNRRNYFFVLLLLMLSLAELAWHLSVMGLLHMPAQIGIQIGLDLILFIIAVIGGRVIPMFTNNGIPGAKARREPFVEKLALGSILLLLVFDAFQAAPATSAMLLLAAAAAHAVRLYHWQPWRTWQTPLVWILHAAYAWIVVYLALRALTATGLLTGPLAIHALTIGTIGGMTIGMMTRTARGHTGRPLVADRYEIACFTLIQLAAVVRVFGGMFVPDASVATVIISGMCWTAAFALFAARYWPILSRPRIDGKPG